MTDEQIDNLQPGRELDRLIAQHVFGLIPLTKLECNIILEWEARRGSGGIPSVDGLFRDDQGQIRWIGRYSTEIRDAWEVFDKLYSIGLSVSVQGREYISDLGTENKPHWCIVLKRNQCKSVGTGDTPMLAICRAALKAIIECGPQCISQIT